MFDRAPADLDPPALIVLFEQAWAGIWRRSETAIGEIGLGSIAEVALSSGAKAVEDAVHFVDLGVLLRTKGLPGVLTIVLESLKKIELERAP